MTVRRRQKAGDPNLFKPTNGAVYIAPLGSPMPLSLPSRSRWGRLRSWWRKKRGIGEWVQLGLITPGETCSYCSGDGGWTELVDETSTETVYVECSECAGGTK